MRSPTGDLGDVLLGKLQVVHLAALTAPEPEPSSASSFTHSPLQQQTGQHLSRKRVCAALQATWVMFCPASVAILRAGT